MHAKLGWRRRVMAATLPFVLLLLCLLPLSTGKRGKGSRGPWFNGWCTRITDLKAQRTMTLILGSFQNTEPQWSEVYTAVLVADADGEQHVEQVFSDPAQALMQNADDFSFPSGLRLSARLSGRILWNAEKPLEGPEGWVRRLPSAMLPTHYFVETLASPTDYELNGQQGQGFAHQEMNYGKRFPSAFVWSQGIADGGTTQLVLTGGKFTISGLTTNQYILAFRSKHRQWTFRTIDGHGFRDEVDGCNGTFSLLARSRGRRLELVISAPVSSFSENIFVPTAKGFSRTPGSTETHMATAVVRLWEARQKREFGGHYNCAEPSMRAAPAQSQGSQRLAFVGFQEPKGRFRGRHSHSLGRGKLAAVARRSAAPAALWTGALAAALLLRAKFRQKQRTLQEGIADFYDASTGDNSWRSLKQHREAQVRMIEEVLSWAEVSSDLDPPQAILDVGCGVGGSSRYLQKKYGAKVTGITLSPKQQAQATALSKSQPDCTFKVADALKMPFADNSFDLVWSLESGEHMPEKAKFMSEMHRVCKPGGRIILVTWVHRNLEENEALKPKDGLEVRLLKRISQAYHLPDWCSIDDYCHIATEKLGMTGIRSDDWSKFIAPFWSAVIQTALQPRGWWALARGGLETFRGALVMPLMNRGYRTGTVRFGLMTGCKVQGGDIAAASTAAASAPSALSAWKAKPERLALCGALGQVVSSTTKSSRLAALLAKVKTVWDFTRPHTLIGTVISITTVHLFAVAPLPSISWPLFAIQTIRALVPAMLVNVYITGLNQIYDAARLSTIRRQRLETSVLIRTAGVMALQFPLIASAILGTAYSVPPFRLKRFPFLAALSIIVVRGVVVNMGFYYYIGHALGVAGQVSTFRSAMAAAFFAAFGLDVPDVIGDQKASIRSVSVRLGPARALQIAVFLLKSLLLSTAVSFSVASVLAIATGVPGTAIARGVLAAEKLVDAEEPKQVFEFYMFVWKIFYLPVVALACGAHFVVCSAEVALPRLDPEENPNVSQEDLLLGFCDANSPGVGSSVTSWRPAHLPPKAEEESEHHRNLVRALERNVQRRLLQEQREEQQRRQREERRERRLQEHTDVWLHELLPSFVPGMEPTQRMQRLWRQGLPPRVREVVWPVAIGNVLRITPELFEIHKQRAVDARRAQVTASNVLITLTDAPPNRGREQSTTCIPFDLPRTFPTLAFFSEGGPVHEDCARILEAYTFFRPDIGYVQGMSYLAAMLLLYLPPYESFVGLCNLLNTPSVLGLYRLEPRAVACRARVFEQLCSQQLPDVCRCIRDVGLMPEMFLIDWFLTVFAKCLTVDVASVVWDLFLLDGEVVLYCTAIAILRILEFQLLHPDGRRGLNAAQPDLESCTRVLNEELRKRVSDPDELLWHIAQVRRRAPQRIFGEIRAIENMEFGSQGRVSTRGSIASALTGASFFTAAKERILSRLLP
eukprot:s489_g17.t1